MRTVAMGALLLALLASGARGAQQDDEAAALALADQDEGNSATAQTCIAHAEGAVSETTYADGESSRTGGRASAALRCDGSLAPRWRLMFADRLDDFWAQRSAAQALNTLKDAYVSFRQSPTALIDAGRINVREGVGLAYNPTDYFRADAVRAVLSIDPDTLRDERLGTLMMRAQTLWASGSLTAMLAPRVSAAPSDSTFNPDFGATNSQNRAVLLLSQRLLPGFQPQLLLTQVAHQSPQVGVDLTHLLNGATVAYLEWSGGRSASNLVRSGALSATAGDSTFRSRLSTGLTYTTPTKLSLTAEYELDEAAPGREAWSRVRNGPLAPYVQYREYAAFQGELATRQNLFTYARYEDAGLLHLDLTAFVRIDPYDHSRVAWAEARYHWEHAGIALQWTPHGGDATSDLAPWPVHQTWLALLDYYF